MHPAAAHTIDAGQSASDIKDSIALALRPQTFAIMAIVILAATFLEKLPAGLAGALPLMIVLGTALDVIGRRTPIVKDYLGGGPIVVIFASAALATTWTLSPGARAVTVLPPSAERIVSTFMKDQGFLDFYIASLITGSVLGLERAFLIRAAIRYVPAIMGSMLVATLLTGVVGAASGYGFQRAVFYIAIPIMGGGMGAGAVPLAEMFSQALHTEPKEMLSVMVPAVALGNALAIIVAGILNKLVRTKPSWTGYGKLMRMEDSCEASPEQPDLPTAITLGCGLFVATTFFVWGNLLGKWVSLHPYALMILSVAAVKILGLTPRSVERGCAQWFQLVVQVFTPALLVGIGVAYTDLHAVLGVMSPVYLFLVSTTIVGAGIGAAVVSHFVGFYPMEGALTAGLCMANMGGTGDVAVLSAANRIELMPFAQISSRVGGAFMLVAASLLLQTLR